MSKTVAKCSKKARAFQLTLNDVDCWEDLLSYLRSLRSLNYCIACLEKAPTTGHKHVHAYAQFVTPLALSLKKLCGAHIEVCRASPEENIEYIKKTKQPEKRGEIIFEWGTPRLCYVPTIKEAKEMAPEMLEGLNLNYYNIASRIQAEQKKYIDPEEYYKEMEVFWIYGESGAGKTRWAIEDMKKAGVKKFNEVKFDGSFWHGVTEDCACCLYDDFRDSHMKPTELINFIDYNRHIMNVKGGSVRNNYTRIYITSLQSPEHIYPKTPEESSKQWLRRIKKIINIQIINN